MAEKTVVNKSNDKRLDKLQAEIERTRSDMHRTINELQRKLSPSHLIREELGERVRETALGRTRDMTSSVSVKARNMGSRMLDLIKKNPFPVFMTGTSIGWLIMGVSRGKKSYYEKTAGLSEGAGERAREYAGRSGEK